MHRFFRWREKLLAATSEQAIDDLIAEYLLTVPPAVIENLPSDCRNAILSGDVQFAAVALLQCEMAHRGDQALGDVLHEMAHTYAAASVRLSKLRVEPIVPKDK